VCSSKKLKSEKKKFDLDFLKRKNLFQKETKSVVKKKSSFRKKSFSEKNEDEIT
jgi:hypothetical protein